MATTVMRECKSVDYEVDAMTCYLSSKGSWLATVDLHGLLLITKDEGLEVFSGYVFYELSCESNDNNEHLNEKYLFFGE
jgi:hypothetical protein